MREKICKISLFSAILACITVMPADATVRTKNSNRSYASGHQQVNALRQQQEYADSIVAKTAESLPVMVDDERLANSIANNEANAPSVSDLESCSMIYPNGVFKWGIPESGSRAGQGPQCIAVVQLTDMSSHTVLATTTVAAGDSMKCNIDYFPDYSYNLTALAQIGELPADREPTIEDVKTVMNQEQKQNAGLKIVAGALIAGVAGNLLSPKTAGSSDKKDSKINIPLGTGHTQLVNTAVGAAAGAGIMAASTYSGKVAGDTIKSTAVNAASGMIIGNMMAGMSGGEDILSITKCSLEEQEFDCVVGQFEEYGGSFEPSKKVENIDTNKKSDMCGEDNQCQSETGIHLVSRSGNTIKRCCKCSGDYKYTCKPANVNLSDINIELKSENSSDESCKKTKSLKKVINDTSERQDITFFEPDGDNQDIFSEGSGSTESDKAYYKICTAREIKGSKKPAYALFEPGSLKNKTFGYKQKDWQDLNANVKGYYHRNSSGSVGGPIKWGSNPAYQSEDSDKKPEGNFTPLSRDAEDGGIVDLSNSARTKGTLAGTAVGGALGGFSGYQGAKTEINERWAAAKREYDDSVLRFACQTGIRWLAQYNEELLLPSSPINQQQ